MNTDIGIVKSLQTNTKTLLFPSSSNQVESEFLGPFNSSTKPHNNQHYWQEL